MKLGVILGTFLLGLALVMSTTPANAGYNFNVEVINKTKKTTILVSRVVWSAKGVSTNLVNICWLNQTIKPGQSYKARCSESSKVQKWQRMINVIFSCNDGQSDIEISFPRSGKYYARGHATKNSDTYSMNILDSDC